MSADKPASTSAAAAAAAPPQAKAKAKASKGLNFLFGGGSGMMATCVVQPIDLVKTRMQLSGEGGAAASHRGPISAVQNIIKNEGALRLYTGLSAALLRQATYTTTRLGVYSTLMQTLQDDSGAPLPFYKKAFAGMAAGGIGAVVGNPAEVALIRMTADGRLPPEQRRNYSNGLNAVYRVAREEGVLTLWRGTGPTVARAMALNCTQLASYSQVKQMLLSTQYFQDNIGCHFASSLVSGFLSTVVSLPIDMAKTRLQNMTALESGKLPYKGMADVWAKTVAQEGFFSLWKGFTPYFFRLAPHTILTFLFVEQMNSLYNKYSGNNRVSAL